LLENGSANTPVAKQWLNSLHVIAAAETHVIKEETFSMQSMPGPGRYEPEGWKTLPSSTVKTVTDNTSLCE
jgi:hypothetical protein